MRSKYLIILFLIVVPLAVYWQTGSHEFVNYDDPGYVVENPHVNTGLTGDNIRWAFTAISNSNWHPLTWLSHMLDCQLYGLTPKGHHLTSVFLHIVNAVLLFVLFRRMTGAQWQSAFVAALFALHPLHVESVAWVAERKDVLSASFFMLTLLAYTRYAERPTLGRYLPVFFSFVLGLMAKPMLVTLPFILLLLDYWPLGRSQAKPAGLRLVLEKIPLFVLSIASSIITIYAQNTEGAISSMEAIPFVSRLANTVLAYAGYIEKTVWPARLIVLYPLTDQMPVWKVAGAILLLVCVSAIVFRQARRFPFLPVGWLWFLGMLVPVIGLVQVGSQSMADRYTYLPLIGLFIMIAWGGAELLEKWRHRRIALFASAVTIIMLLSSVTWLQIRHWKNSVELLSHALKFTSNAFLYNNLGLALASQGKLDEAIIQYTKALQLNPNDDFAHYNLGLAFAKQGKLSEAVYHYSESLRINPGDSETRALLDFTLNQLKNAKGRH